MAYEEGRFHKGVGGKDKGNDRALRQTLEFMDIEELVQEGEIGNEKCPCPMYENLCMKTERRFARLKMICRSGALFSIIVRRQRTGPADCSSSVT